MIISRELGLNFCENPWQGSFIVNELTELVEEAVYQEFERISDRGGVLGAMDTMYQRGKIQDESLYYESKKHDGSLPLIGVNTFLPKEGQEDEVHELELIRSSEAEKQNQIRHVRVISDDACEESEAALVKLQSVARDRGNIFAELMNTVKSNSLGQISGRVVPGRRRVPPQYVDKEILYERHRQVRTAGCRCRHYAESAGQHEFLQYGIAG